MWVTVVMVSLHGNRILTKTLSHSFLRFFHSLLPFLPLIMPCSFISQVDLHSNFSKLFPALLQTTVAHLERSMGYVSIPLNRSLGTSCSDSNLYLASISTWEHLHCAPGHQTQFPLSSHFFNSFVSLQEKQTNNNKNCISPSSSSFLVFLVEKDKSSLWIDTVLHGRESKLGIGVYSDAD